MTTIFELVDDALTTLTPVPYAMKPYLGDLPDTFMDYQLISGDPEQHADNAEIERSYTVQVTIWSVNGLVSLPNIDAAMVAAGFQKGPERQLPTDPQTGHYGLAKDYVYF
jgi:hypothetical protein